MEHIVQFGVTIDDDAIQKHVMQCASEAITKDIRDVIFNFRYGSPSGFKSEIVGMVKSVLEEILEESKDEIIRLAAHEVAETMRRSKKYKEIMKAIEETVND